MRVVDDGAGWWVISLGLVLRAVGGHSLQSLLGKGYMVKREPVWYTGNV